MGRVFIEEKKLIELLKIVIKKMQGQKMLVGANPDQLIEGILANIKKGNNNIDFSIENGPALINRLCVIVAIEAANQTRLRYENPALRISLDYAPMINDLNNVNSDKQLIADLELQIKKQLIRLNKFSPKPASSEEISELAKQLALSMVCRPGQEKRIENEEEMTRVFLTLTFLEQLSLEELALRNMNAGLNPQLTGSIPGLVLVIIGNLIAAQNITQGLPTAMAERERENRYDTGADYYGKELTLLTNQVAGGVAIVDTVPEIIAEAGTLLPSSRPKLKMDGGAGAGGAGTVS